MKDWLFFPGIALVAAAIILFALRGGGDVARLSEADVRSQGYGLSGDALIDLTASPGTEVVVSDGTAKLVAIQDQANAPPGAGVFLTIPPRIERMFMGEELEVVWKARRVRGEGGARIGYFTVGAGDSGWEDHALGEDWKELVLRFRPGRGEANFDYVGFWPSAGEADGVPVEVESVRVRLVP